MRIQATTLSVLLKGSPSVHCFVKLGRKSFNVTLRFDHGDRAVICGYPQDVAVYNTNINQYDHDSPDCETLFESEGLDPKEYGFKLYVSREIEQSILNRLYTSLAKQFKDPMFLDACPENERQAALNKIEKTIYTIFDQEIEGAS